MHQAAYDWVRRHAHDRPGFGVDIGGREVNGTARHLFTATEWWVIDAQEGGPEVDEVADGATFRPAQPVDVVLCTEVFEHAPDWREIVENIAAILRPGGETVLTMAGPGRPAHGFTVDAPRHPGWYRNIDPDDLRDALNAAGFGTVVVDQEGDDVRAWAVL